MAGSPAPDWRAPCGAQRLSWESDVEDGARKLGTALEDGSCLLGGPCGLRAKEKTDLETMEVATVGATKTDPVSDCGAQEAAGAGSAGLAGQVRLQRRLGKVARERAWVLWHAGVGNTEGS